MRPHLLLLVFLLLISPQVEAAEPEFPLTDDSKPQPTVPKGEMIKDAYASNGGIFPGTQREYQLYIPHGLDRSKPAAFMVFQDGVIYQAPVVFDNLIAKKDIPPLIGVFIKPGVVAAANENALPRFNRSYEYDSITDNYSRFLIEEFLPAIEKKHGIKLSMDPNDAAISGNSSGGIAAFMVAWHRSDRFRRVFTGVGTYVGIHGGDRLPVLVRKVEPKPIRIFLQSGTGDNNLYCGDWWMANQMMERSFTWAGYDVNHAWGEGGHNQKHASQIFPDVMRWLWRDWQTNKEIKANAKGESKWKGYEVCEAGKGWEVAADQMARASSLASDRSGDVFAVDSDKGELWKISGSQPAQRFGSGFAGGDHGRSVDSLVVAPNGKLLASGLGNSTGMSIVSVQGKLAPLWAGSGMKGWAPCMSNDGWIYLCRPLDKEIAIFPYSESESEVRDPLRVFIKTEPYHATLSPDQTQIFVTSSEERHVQAFKITSKHELESEQAYFELEMDETGKVGAAGLCVDTDGRLYVATSLGIQVCDQAGRVNFIIPTPERPLDVCFGGKDLGALFIACGSKVYKRSTKVHGIVSGQMPPIKPAAPKL